jgi:regulator of sigma E protease
VSFPFIGPVSPFLIANLSATNFISGNFSTQKLYKRFLIVAAGPIANLILAIFLYMGIFSAGQPAASTKIGNVVSTSPAYVAGFRSGDKVLAVNDFKPITWNEFDECHFRTVQH